MDHSDPKDLLAQSLFQLSCTLLDNVNRIDQEDFTRIMRAIHSISLLWLKDQNIL